MATWSAASKTLQNPYMSVRLEPRHGGRIVSLVGPAGELTRPATAAALSGARVPFKFGLLSLQLWQDSYWHNDLCHLTWPTTNVITGPTAVDVTLSGASVRWPGVTVTRTYRLTDDPWIDVHHELDPGSTTGPYPPPAFWFSNAMRSLGKTFVPGPAGVVDLPRFPQDQSWCHEPTDGWIAWISGTRGLAFATAPTRLRHVRVSHLDFDSVDWIRRRIDKVDNAVVRLIPFRDLDRVDGVGAAGVVAAEVTQTGASIDLYPIATGQATVAIWTLTPNGVQIPYGTAQASVVAGQSTTILVAAPATPVTGQGGWRYGSVVIGGPTPATTTFRAAVPLEFRGQLRCAVATSMPVTEVPRADGAHLRPPRSFQFDALPVPLPDESLARPLKAKPRVLALVPATVGPTVLALARRFDLAVTLPHFPLRAELPTGPNGIAGQRLLDELGDRSAGAYGDDLIAVWTEALSVSHTYDVILLDIGDYFSPANRTTDPWQLLPQALQAEILSRVQAGTGLVMVRRGPPLGPNAETATLKALLPLMLQNNSDFLGQWRPGADRTVAGLPWALMDQPGLTGYFSVRAGATLLLELAFANATLPVLARSQFGNGRVLDLAWGVGLVPIGLQPPTAGAGFDRFRYDLDLLGRLVFDAANRPPAIAVLDVVVAGTAVTVRLDQVAVVAPAFDLDWQARDRFGVLLGSGRTSFATFPPGGALTLTIPSGSWACDVVVTPRQGDSGWGAGARALDVPLTVAPDLAAYDPPQSLRITAALPPGATHCLVELVNGRGRILERADFTPNSPATISLGKSDTPHAELRAHAFDAAGQLVGQGYRQVRVRIRTGFTAWPSHFWTDLRSLPLSLQARRLDTNRSLGVSAHYILSNPLITDPLIAAADRVAVPYVVQSSGWITSMGGQTLGGVEDPITLTDDQEIVNGQARDRALAARLADANVLYYRAGDDDPDPPASDVCYAPRTLEWFQDWLRARYGHSEALFKTEWRPVVTPSDPTPIWASKPLKHADALDHFEKHGTYAPWVDHARFMMDLFSAAPAGARTALAQGDPAALVGSCGDTRTAFFTGRDWWVRGRSLDVVGRYALSTRIELQELGTLTMLWTGYDDPDPLIRHRVASILGLGDSGVALFNEASLVNPDLSLPEVGRDLAAALLPTRRGVARLFASAKPATDGIFVMSSPDSSPVLAIHGYESLTGNPPGLGADAREMVHQLLATMGVGWRAIDPLDVETGRLEREGARVLILPCCAALSDSACEAIRRWVERGGCLIADLLPGTFTASGRLRGSSIGPTGTLAGSTNPLDAVFGLTPGARPPITPITPIPPTTVTIGATTFPTNCADTSAGPIGTAASGGTTTGGQPLWFANAYGLGQAFYLGCSFFSDYPWGVEGKEAERRAMQEELAKQLAHAGITSRAQVTAGATRVSSCDVWIRQLGSAELVVLARNYVVIYPPTEPDVDGVLTFRGLAHTYDMDEGTYLGYGDRLDLKVGRYTFRLFSRLSYQVTGVSVRAPAALPLGQALDVSVTIQTAGGAPGPHLVRIDLLDEDQRPMSDLAREAMTACGSATVSIPTAFNDPTGRWTIVATDVLTGTQRRTRINMLATPSPAPMPAVNRIYGIDD